MAAVNVLYNVGARDERPDRTGMAHLFEHLMFGGSANVPDFDAAIEAAGGTDNAWTSNDFTNFYDIIPAVNIETAFWIESDRMLYPALSEEVIETQKGVVVEEWKQVCLNRPYGELMHTLRPMVYGTHPYRYPALGISPEHVEAVSQSDAKEFFFSHYAPNNAVLAVCGDISEERTLELAEKWFGDIPRREIAPRTYPAPEPLTGPVEKHITSHVPHARVTMAFPMSRWGTEEYYAADLITDLLASGRASRFFRHLTQGSPLFVSADASITGSEEEGMLMLDATLSTPAPEDIETARQMLLDEAMCLCTKIPTEEEMHRARTRARSQQTFGEMEPVDRARALAMCEMHGIAPADRLRRYEAVTPEAVMSAAQRIIDPSRCATVIYHPTT